VLNYKYVKLVIIMKRLFVCFVIATFLFSFNTNSFNFQDNRTFLMGMVANPKNYPNFTINDLEEAYYLTSISSEIVNLWLSVPWWEEEEKFSSPSTRALLELIYKNKLTPIFHTNFWSLQYVEGYGIAPLLDIPPDMPANTTLQSEEFRHRWLEHVTNISKEWQPAFYSLGNEIDLFYNYEANQADFDNYVSLVAESYDAIKSVSPHTKVMVIFKIENLMDKNTWFLIDKFDKNKLDLIAFTSYPYLNETYDDPADLPADYYAKIMEHTNGMPIAFTEIGWSSSFLIGGNEEKQAEFLSWFINVTEDMPIKIVCWLFLHDMSKEGQETNANELLGLRKHNGEEKMVWQRWKNLHDVPYKNSPPSIPAKPSGKSSGKINTPYTYSTFSSDADNDCLYYLFDWGDGSQEWFGPFEQGTVINATHEWKEAGNYVIKVKARDLYEESEWSEGLAVSMPLSFLKGAVKISEWIEIFGRVILYRLSCFNSDSTLEIQHFFSI